MNLCFSSSAAVGRSAGSFIRQRLTNSFSGLRTMVGPGGAQKLRRKGALKGWWLILLDVNERLVDVEVRIRNGGTGHFDCSDAN